MSLIILPLTSNFGFAVHIVCLLVVFYFGSLEADFFCYVYSVFIFIQNASLKEQFKVVTLSRI